MLAAKAECLSDELKLAMACCRWPVCPEAIVAAVKDSLDWSAFINLLGRHGVVALAGNALWKATVDIPSEHARALKDAMATQARLSLHTAAENAILAKRFEAAGIEARFVKGPTLAMLAYADLGLKRSADIDVLVSAYQLREACTLLVSYGFEQQHGVDLNDEEFARYLRWAKEIAFIDRSGTVIELHVSLTQNRRILKCCKVDDDYQDIMIASSRLATFIDTVLYSYLCYHGAIHAWSRLKWLADLNAFLDGRDMTALHRSAVAQGVGEASLVALSLCRDILGRSIDLPGRLSVLGHCQRRIALSAIRSERGGSDISTFSPIGISMVLGGTLIGNSFSSLLGGLAAIWSQPQIRAHYSPRDAWMFHVLRIPRFLIRFIKGNTG